MSFRIINSDCLDAMRTMQESSVDAIVTDPPYGINFMNSKWDCPGDMLGQMATGKTKCGALARGGSHNRGYKDCDNAKFQSYMTPIFAEALRVAKPGAYLLAFGGTRTYHRLACAIEDAGWEIRDCIMWVYGCLDEETEILVDGEFVPYNKAKKGSLALGYDIESRTFSWQRIEDMYLYDYDDTAYAIQSDSTDQLVSRNHRCIIERGGMEQFAFAEQVAQEREASVPVLEGLHGLLDRLPLPDERAGAQALRSAWGAKTTLARVTPIHYEGKMWCIKVATGAFVARRHGKIFITGNSGFPKSMDVSKAIAKRAGGELEAKNAIEFMRARREELGLSRIEFEKRIFGMSDGNVRNWEDGISIPIPGLWTSIKKAMELDETPFDSVMERGDREVSRETGSFGYQKDRERWESEHVEREAVTDIAKEWSGWGTCLKPAWEPIIVARKPLEGTVAANVLKYGTGAINIDDCRVPTEGEKVLVHNAPTGSFAGGEQGRGSSRNNDGNIAYKEVSGRFPANLIHDGSEEVMECFPDNVKGWTWNRTDGARPFNNEGNPTNYKSAGSDKSVGSAARFFYCAKASKADRGEGNDHPTVKPIALMKYLVKLVCRQGGTVLDPFCGSGTTGIAAVELGDSFIGIERDGHYFSIAESRVGKAAEKMDETAEL